MLESLSDKLQGAVKAIRGQARLTEANIDDALRDVRMSLLEADVNFKVVKEFVADVKTNALGRKVLSSLSPGNVFIKSVNDELCALLGGETGTLDLAHKPPVVIMLVGLQGVGKTTSAAKLAVHLRDKEGRRPYLVPADVRRPAAIDQLKKLAADNDFPVWDTGTKDNPVKISRKAIDQAEKESCDVVIIDTAGRLHLDKELMSEISKISSKCSPAETLLVADGMSGQDAVNSAAAFGEACGITGVVLTKMDGDARGGAALSINKVTGAKIKFIGTGEKVGDFEPLHPERLANRILGMGDIVSLVEKAQEVVDEQQAEKMARKLRKNEFSLEDFLTSLEQMGKLGSITQVMGMIPGMGKMMPKNVDEADLDKRLRRTRAIIQSMTRDERAKVKIINGSRRKRIAAGSGTQVADVNRLLKDFKQMKKMMSRMQKQGLPRALAGMKMPPGGFQP